MPGSGRYERNTPLHALKHDVELDKWADRLHEQARRWRHGAGGQDRRGNHGAASSMREMAAAFQAAGDLLEGRTFRMELLRVAPGADRAHAPTREGSTPSPATKPADANGWDQVRHRWGSGKTQQRCSNCGAQRRVKQPSGARYYKINDGRGWTMTRPPCLGEA